MSKSTAVKIVSPKGIAVYPWLNKPDTKFNENGEYRVRVQLPQGSDTDDFIEKLEGIHAAAVAQAKKDNPGKKIKVADLPIVEDEAGNKLVTFKLKASGLRKDGTPFTQKPGLFDSKLNPLPESVVIGGGSTITVSAEAAPFYTAIVGAGITLRLKAVKVSRLVEFGSGAAASAFEADDDGFVAEADAKPAAAPFDADEAGDESADY